MLKPLFHIFNLRAHFQGKTERYFIRKMSDINNIITKLAGIIHNEITLYHPML